MSNNQNGNVNEIIFGYWQGYTKSDDAPRGLKDTPAKVNVVSLAFGVIDDKDPNNIIMSFLTSKWSRQEIMEGISFLHARGTKVLLSLNGQPKLQYGGWPALDPEKFASNTAKLLNAWNLDGIDLDNEDNYKPGDEFVEVIKALRRVLNPGAIISLPVYLGKWRDEYLFKVREIVDYVWTMAYWNDYNGQRELLNVYQKLLYPSKAGMGVGIPGMANPGQSTPPDAVPDMAAYTPQSGIMLWALNSKDAPAWYKMIIDHMPHKSIDLATP
ncbi:glycoside hydrolase family 18 protein [Lacrimispora sp. 38-1]|uniref:glycoside hydrolase family 18 protein n=1 Tax=Lacrimispora sp. 38-1 TaxID=3125778 RepID=UPI003CEFC264